MGPKRITFPTNPLLLIFSLLLAVQLFWNAYPYTLGSHATNANFWYNAVYGTTLLVSGTILLYYVFRRQIGGEISSALGYLGTAALVFGLGLYIWTYYNVFLHVPVPRLSVADAFFLVYPWLLVIGTLRLLRFYTPMLRWPALLEALSVFFVAAIPIYRYYIVPSLAENLALLDKLKIYDILIANAVVLGLVYLLWRIGGGRLRKVLTLLSFSYLFLSAGQFIFQHRTDIGVYWNGDVADLLITFHGFLFGVATVLLLDSILNKTDLPPVAVTEKAPAGPELQ